MLLLIMALFLLIIDTEAARKPKGKGKPSKPGKPKPKPKGKPSKPSKPSKPGKPSKPKKPVKPKPKPTDIFKKYTKEKKGGICWWDITRTDCAICKQYVNAMPCGYPMHNYCYRKSSTGCPLITNNKYTLSTSGYPCYWDHSDLRCAWCTSGSFQCGPGKTGPDSARGNRCDKGPSSVCNGVVGDCRHIPMCHVNAQCVFKEKISGRSIFKCKCDQGYMGNGIQCASRETGVIGVDPITIVTVKARLSRDYYDTHTGNFPEPSKVLINEMESLNSECTSKASKCQTYLNMTVKG